MDEIIADGRTYISAKRAAEKSGYTQDYIGQLVRKKIAAIKIGRSWFVEPSALSPSIVKSVSIQERRPSATVFAAAVIQFPRTWSEIRYFSDEEPLVVPLERQFSLGPAAEEGYRVARVVDGVRLQTHQPRPQRIRSKVVPIGKVLFSTTVLIVSLFVLVLTLP